MRRVEISKPGLQRTFFGALDSGIQGIKKNLSDVALATRLLQLCGCFRELQTWCVCPKTDWQILESILKA